MFSDCTKLTSLPATLFGSSDLTELKYARALFANCSSLTGEVPYNYFEHTPNLLNVGAIKGYMYKNKSGSIDRYDFNNYTSSKALLPGAFANTKLYVGINGANTFLNNLSNI